MPMAGIEDAIDRQRAVGTQQIVGGYPIKPLWGFVSQDVNITCET